MNQKLIAELGRSQRLQIVNRLKRTQGLTVGELATLLGMSYMGVKEHCVQLEHAGYLDTWRRPQPAGRPEMLYRLTTRAQDLFPRTSNEATLSLLECARQLYGASAPEKLLFTMFQRRAEQAAAKIKGATPQARAEQLAKLRDREGYMADWIPAEAAIVEHHSPIADLLEAYPLVARLEAELFSKLLGVPVSREESRASGLYACAFRLEGIGVQREFGTAAR